MLQKVKLSTYLLNHRHHYLDDDIVNQLKISLFKTFRVILD